MTFCMSRVPQSGLGTGSLPSPVPLHRFQGCRADSLALGLRGISSPFIKYHTSDAA